MALHNGIDTVAYASLGVFTKTYGSGQKKNICNLFASLGLFEDLPRLVLGWILSFDGRGRAYAFDAGETAFSFDTKKKVYSFEA
jgi:hypothetical protein